MAEASNNYTHILPPAVLGLFYEYKREPWCFLTMARRFSRSSSVSLAPRLGISASICEINAKGIHGGEVEDGGHVSVLLATAPRRYEHTCAHNLPHREREKRHALSQVQSNMNLCKYRCS